MGRWQEFTDVDPVVHQPGRMLLLTILAAAESADFLFLSRESGLTKGNLSTHLSKLEAAGYIKIAKSFHGKVPSTMCSITRAGRVALQGHRDRLKSIATQITRSTASN